MAAKNACCCGACKVRDRNGDACLRCKPKYICVEVVVTPGPYSEYSECCEAFGFRLAYDCGGYAGSGSCPDGVSLDIDVRLVDTAEGCTTVVSSSLLVYDLTFEGTLPAIEFEVENEAGDTLAVTINGASMVENPLSKACDAVCVCLNCIPETLCAEVYIESRFVYVDDEVTTDYLSAKQVAVIGTFDCTGWVFADQEITYEGYPYEGGTLTLSVEFVATSYGYCGLHITGALPRGSHPDGDFVIDEYLSLESALDPRRIRGTDCGGDQGEAWIFGGTPDVSEPGDEIPPHEFTSLIDQNFYFVFGDPETQSASYARIRDNACGVCVACNPPIPEACCPELPDELQISLTNSADPGTTTGVLTRGSGASWTGVFTITSPGCEALLAVTLFCEADQLDPWFFTFGGCKVLVRTPIDTQPVDCDAFTATKTILMDATTSCFCNNPNETDSITIVVTA